MSRHIAFILAGATVALGFGGYLMSKSMGVYDLNKASKTEAARLDRLEKPDENGSGMFAALLEKASIAMETSRNVYLGEYFPPTPTGWVLKKTHHDEIVDFTVKNNMELDITDKGSLRRLSGLGGQSTARTTDLAYRNGEKVIFMRLVFANKPLKTPLKNVHAWMFNGMYSEGADVVLGSARFKTRTYAGTDLINIASSTGFYTGIGILTNASMGEVEALLDSMDMQGFASQTGDPKGETAASFLVSGDGLEMISREMDQTSATDEDIISQDAASEPIKASKTFLSSILGGEEDGGKPTFLRKSKDKSGSAFKKIGSFSSACQTGGGAKICRVGE